MGHQKNIKPVPLRGLSYRWKTKETITKHVQNASKFGCYLIALEWTAHVSNRIVWQRPTNFREHRKQKPAMKNWRWNYEERTDLKCRSINNKNHFSSPEIHTNKQALQASLHIIQPSDTRETHKSYTSLYRNKIHKKTHFKKPGFQSICYCTEPWLDVKTAAEPRLEG